MNGTTDATDKRTRILADRRVQNQTEAATLIAFAKARCDPEFPSPPLDAHADEALAERDYARYLGLFGSHERVFPFLSIHTRLTDDEYWRALGSVWINSEWSHEFRPLWDWLFLSNRNRAGSVAMMDAAERERWDELPNEFRVYRGQQRRRDPIGYSWTLSHERAVWFANVGRPRFTDAWLRGPGLVLSGLVCKSDALAYLNGRTEEEILIPVGKVRSIRSGKL